MSRRSQRPSSMTLTVGHRSRALSVPLSGVELHRLVTRDDLDRPGYLARFEASRHQFEPRLADLAWTLEAMAHLNPEAFMFTEISVELAISERFRTLERHRNTLIPIVEPGRVGRRREAGARAVATLGAMGMMVLAGGHRPRLVAGCEGIAASARTLAGGSDAMVVTDIESAHDVGVAQGYGARYLGGPWLADPIRLAPVDVGALRGRADRAARNEKLV